MIDILDQVVCIYIILVVLPRKGVEIEPLPMCRLCRVDYEVDLPLRQRVKCRLYAVELRTGVAVMSRHVGDEKPCCRELFRIVTVMVEHFSQL